MNHLHSVGVLHRDLKLANILLHFPNLEGSVKPSNDNKNTVFEGGEKMTFDQIDEWLKKPQLLTRQPFLVKIADLGFSKIL